MSRFIDRCLVLMAQKNISQKQLAELIDKPYKSVNNWFSNRSFSPKTADAVNIAKALNTSVEFLETGESEKNSLSPIRKAFQEFIDMSTDVELQKMWDFFELMRGRKK